MIIEFVGIPGSGKTHISEQLYKEIKKIHYEEVEVYNYSDIYIKLKNDGKIKCFIKMIPYIFKKSFLTFIIKILTRKSSLSLRKNLLMIFLIRTLVYDKIAEINKQENKKKIFILDEGFTHFSIAFFRHNKVIPKQQDLESFFGKIDDLTGFLFKKKLHIFIDSDIKQNYMRIEKRMKGWPIGIGKLSKLEKQNYLVENHNCYLALRNYQEDSLFIDNTYFKSNYLSDFNKINKYFKN